MRSSTHYFPLATYHFTYLQLDAELCGALLQQILVADHDERNIGRHNGKPHAQIRADARRFAGSDRQWRRKGCRHTHRLTGFFEVVFNKRAVTQLAQPVLVLLV